MAKYVNLAGGKSPYKITGHHPALAFVYPQNFKFIMPMIRAVKNRKIKCPAYQRLVKSQRDFFVHNFHVCIVLRRNSVKYSNKMI